MRFSKSFLVGRRGLVVGGERGARLLSRGPIDVNSMATSTLHYEKCKLAVKSIIFAGSLRIHNGYGTISIFFRMRIPIPDTNRGADPDPTP